MHNQRAKSFITHESFGGILLFFCVITAMLIANSKFSYLYFETLEMPLAIKIGSHTLCEITVLHFINDVLMSFFFLMVGLEMKREVLYGELAGFKSVSFSVFGALGGIIFPIAIYMYFNYGTPSSNAFGIAMSTDTAFALGVILLLGSRIPNVIKTFLVTLAVADDLGAIGVIAVFYTHTISLPWVYVSLLLCVTLMALNYMDVKYISLYFAIGTLLWMCMLFSGIHATVAAVLLAFTIPGKSQMSRHSFLSLKEAYNKIYFDIRPEASMFEPATVAPGSGLKAIAFGIKDFFVCSLRNIKRFMSDKNDAQMETDMKKEHKRVEILDTVSRYSRYAQNPLVRIEYILQPLNAYLIVPLFAFANAGVSILGTVRFDIDGILPGIVAGLVVGKPLGIFIFSILGEKLRVARRPTNLTNMHVISVGMLAGIGFTMSIFVANIAHQHNQDAMDLSKISILMASLAASTLGLISLLFSAKNTQQEQE